MHVSDCYRAVEILTGTAVTQSYLTITANRNTLPQLSVLQMSAKVIHNIFTQGILIFLVEFIPLHVNIIICQIKSIKDITLACTIKYWCRNIKSKCFCSKTQMSLQHLSDVHTRRYAQRV